MPIQFNCTQCGKSLLAPDGSAGRKIKCPQCETIAVIPSPAPSPVTGTPAQQMPSPAAQAPIGEYATGAPVKDPKSRAVGPAIGLAVAAVLNMLLGIATSAFMLYLLNTSVHVQRGEEMMVTVSTCIGGAVATVAGLIILVSSISMIKGKGYGRSMFACILAIIPLFHACCVLTLPFGIWGLVVLRDPAVKAAFKK